jgi:hypothetical protein
MILINFSAPFKPLQISQVEALSHEPVTRVVDLVFNIDSDMQVLPQFKNTMSRLKLSNTDLQAELVVVNLPQQNYLSVMVLAELHARMGYFPPIVRTRMRASGILPFYEVAEVVDLQTIEDQLTLK